MTISSSNSSSGTATPDLHSVLQRCTKQGTPVDTQREQLLHTARLCEQSERMDDLRVCTSKLLQHVCSASASASGSGSGTNQQQSIDLTDEEKQLLYSAFRATINSQQLQLNALGQSLADAQLAATLPLNGTASVAMTSGGAQAPQPHTPGSSDAFASPAPFIQALRQYTLHVEKQQQSVCAEMARLLQSTVLAPQFAAQLRPESRVLYGRMHADWWRRVAELCALHPEQQVESQRACASATQCYAQAQDIAQAQLAATHPVRLALCLNQSVHLYTIAQQRKQACELAKQTFDAAISRLDELDEVQYKDATLVMQLLRDNLTLWTLQEQQAQQQQLVQHQLAQQQQQR